MKKVLFQFVLLMSLFSCSLINDKEKKEKLEREKIDQQEEKNELVKISKLASQYGAVLGFDTLNYQFTAQYQTCLEKNDKIVITNFILNDIQKTDSTYMISLSKSKLTFDLTCNKKQLIKLFYEPEETDFSRYIDKSIAIKISSIKKFKLRPEPRLNEDVLDDELMYKLKLKYSENNFLIKGEILGISE